MLDINQIYMGDCLEVMKDIDDKSIDMILCDLPYGVTACKWDSVISLDKLWEQYKRITKDNTAIVLTATNPFSSRLVMSNIKMYRHEWIWQKQQATNFPNVKRQPLRIHEHILIFSHNNTVYNPQFLQRKPYICKSTRKEGPLHSIKSRIPTVSNGERYPTTILKYKKDAKSLHPTEKPLLLFAYLIETYTNPGMLVLDNCIGSGTTAIAALWKNRNFIGIEKEEKYFNIANKRIELFRKKNRC